ncbi:uncharacterized protein LOC143027591 [Oratosquilla oratoria]|uniref:uncharacterized protein LOC143027591 n=1 Tax=Oratosquilla oratoria TaxID=337810 RepID=UPI003F76D1FE
MRSVLASGLVVTVAVLLCSCLPTPTEGLFFPGEATHRRPANRRPPPTVAEIDKTHPVSFVNENRPSEGSHRRRLQRPSGVRQPHGVGTIIFPTSTSERDPPPAGRGAPLSDENRQDPRSTPKDFLLSVLGGNPTDCDLTAGYIPVDGECERILARSNCADGEWLVYTSGRKFQCQKRPCPWEHVLFRGQCVNVSRFDVCPPGHTLYVDLSGEASCDCQHGYVYGPASGECYAQYTQGPCSRGHHVVIDAKADSVSCIPNKCGTDGWLYHEPSNRCYLKLYDGFCDQEALRFNETHQTVSCEDVLPFNIFIVPRLNECPPGSLRDYSQKCRRAYLPRIPVTSTFPKAKIGSCPPGYTRDPQGTCKKVFNLFA